MLINKLFPGMLFFILLLIRTAPAAAQHCATPECIFSSDIKKADGGVSGQITVTGSGIKTDHIQDGAVTSSKIGIGEVRANNIGPGTISESKLLDGAVTSAKIASGAVMGEKLGNVAWVNVECGSDGCSDSNLGAICDTFQTNARPLSVSCKNPIKCSLSTSCGGNNTCCSVILSRDSLLSDHCAA